MIKQSLKDILVKYDKLKLRSVLPAEEIKIPEFYGMPKIHKNPIKCRPIVPSFNWYTTNASKYLAKRLQEIQDKYPFLVKRQLDLVQELENTKFKNDDILESLYTSIDIEETLRNIKRLLLENRVNVIEANFLIDLLEWVLKNNYF